MCFRVEGRVVVRLESDVLVPQGKHVTEGVLDKEKGFVFDHPFDPAVVGFNNYDFGEFWLGVKLKYDNPEGLDFVSLKMELKIDEKRHSYVFLVPLFNLPLSGLEIYPKNSLMVCGELLVSSRFAFGEFDVSVFSSKEVKGFKIEEKQSWGYYKDDTKANYLRFKGKEL